MQYFTRVYTGRACRAMMFAVILSVTLCGSVCSIHAAAFSNPTPITIRDNNTANPYPSSIVVSGLSGAITDLNVSLYGLSHGYADDMDILLAGPQGLGVILASNVSGGGGGQSISNLNWTFDDDAPTHLPNTNTLTSGAFKPTDYDDQYDPGDNFPSPAPSGPYGTSLSIFNGTSPNGTWNLCVVDDYAGDSGSISGGWGLDFSIDDSHTYMNPSAITIRDDNTANPYPSTISVSGITDTIVDINVGLTGLTHGYADDIDILLVGPQGQSVILASNVSGMGGGQSISNLNWTFDDEAASYLPNTNTLTSGTFKPTDYDDQYDSGDNFASPAPSGPYGTMLSVFDGIDPNGDWSLYVVDDYAGDAGCINGGWWISFETTPEPTTMGLLGLGAVALLKRRRR